MPHERAVSGASLVAVDGEQHLPHVGGREIQRDLDETIASMPPSE